MAINLNQSNSLDTEQVPVLFFSADLLILPTGHTLNINNLNRPFNLLLDIIE